jgi:single-stranded-DNA-specific exonuclease
MTQLPKRWQIAPRITTEAERELSHYPPILRQILYNRGYATRDEAQCFLEAAVPEGSDSMHLLGISEAIHRLEHAVRDQEHIAVYGDYDVDGVTATALLELFLSGLGARVEAYIPNRFEEGYGLNKEALEELHNRGVNLVITVDCGIRSLEEIEYAQRLGLDMIISDHHHPGPELPNALAVIDPKQPGDPYPEKDLAGVGLAYKIADALGRHLQTEKPRAADYLDLVALGTVADLVPLTGENRSLVRDGLILLQNTNRQGLWSLMSVANLEPRNIMASHIGFILGPRLNAAGRLDSAQDALQLLTTKDIQQAGKLAQQLDVQNRERQRITREIQVKAEELALAEDPDALLLFAVHPDFNSGVVGLAASRLVDHYYRPAIVGQQSAETTRASCRSISEFHITDALDQCADLLVQHGGHAAAAGFTVRNEDLPELKERLKQIAFDKLAEIDLRPTLYADAEIDLSDLKPEILDYLEALQPTGYGNRQALFVSRNLKVNHSRTVGRENSHLKMVVTDGWITFDAIAFRQGYWYSQMPPRIDLIYAFEANEFLGRTTLQLRVLDLKPSGMVV